MYYLALTLLPLIAIFLESTIFQALAFKGVIPDLLLIFVINYALLHGCKKGSIYGCICGLLEDMYLGRFIGVNFLSKGLTAFVVGKFTTSVFKENMLVGVMGTLMGTILNILFMTFLAAVNFQNFALDFAFAVNVLWHISYNTLIAAPVYIWYYHSHSRGVLQYHREI